MPAVLLVDRGREGAFRLLELWRRGFADSLDPVWALGSAAAVVVGLAASVALAADAGWDRRVPAPALAAVALLALAPLPGGGGPARGEAQLLRCGALLAAGSSLGPGCQTSHYRDRWLRRLPLRIARIEGVDGPLREPEAGMEPGTLVVAQAAEGRFGWVGAVALGSEGPEMLRRDGAVWTAGFLGGGEVR